MNFEDTLTVPCDTSRGSSDTANYIDEQKEEGRNLLQESFYLGIRSDDLISELYTVTEECDSNGWDGTESTPISEKTFLQAYHFIKSLPFGIEAPTVSAEPDGHIVFEWYQSPTRLLSISISPDGLLHYAALLGPRKYFGTEPFLDYTPKSIIDLILQITNA